MSGETKDSESGFTTDTALRLAETRHAEMTRRIDDLERHLEERFFQQTKALDERYAAQTRGLDERYATQTKALDAAFTAADKAVQAALEAAEKAVSKAENATASRFEQVNEFRGQLADQATTFMPRAEAQVATSALSEKVDQHNLRTDERFTDITARLDTTAGQEKGGTDSNARVIAIVGAIAGLVGVATAIVALFTR